MDNEDCPCKDHSGAMANIKNLYVRIAELEKLYDRVRILEGAKIEYQTLKIEREKQMEKAIRRWGLIISIVMVISTILNFVIR